MSLLEDVFLQDEADEAQELERVIEGDEFDERPRASASDSDENSEKEDEAVEDKRRVDPTQAKAKRVIKNPRFILNIARLTGPRGIHVIPEHFKDFKFKGKGHEKEDLDLVLKKLEHWAYRLYPKFQFEDCLKKIETLGKKRPVMVHLHKIRSDQFQSDEPVIQKDSSDEETPAPPEEDEFDRLLQQQIELARATPAPGSVGKGFQTASVDIRTPLTMPKATSSPSISDEQRERMIRNRQLAEERRLANLKQNPVPIVDMAETTHTESDKNEIYFARKHNRSNIIDSSDEDDIPSVNQAEVSVDIHKTVDQNTIDVNDDDSTGQEISAKDTRVNTHTIDESDIIDITEQEIHKNTTLDEEVTMNTNLNDIAVNLIGTDNVDISVDARNTIDESDTIDKTEQEIHNNRTLVKEVSMNTNHNNLVVVDLIGTNNVNSSINRVNTHNTIDESDIIDITQQVIHTKTTPFKEVTMIDLSGTDKSSNEVKCITIEENSITDQETSGNKVPVVDLIGTDNTNKAIKKDDARKTKNNKSDTDSSDDECVLTSDEIQDTVFVHRSMNSDTAEKNDLTKTNYTTGLRTNDILAEKSQTLTNRKENDTNVDIEEIKSNNIELDVRVHTINTLGNENEHNVTNSNEQDIIKNGTDDIEMIEVTVENDQESSHFDKMHVESEEARGNDIDEDIVEDLIDVDFSDDF